ncbi:LysR family transcriptional regulator [Lactococcus hodotermopsidis]|uniref:LysR family transcriptional regulator n=1 Tax=Pseudolactococcus hodotermopsidis TaxID=2709157 RepID=A0A6A0BER4_9LACT|nr:LysR family transcriptional regulator [Lactococcus hodotermopsidis]GFH42327.1 LysR family transcriptional regulator [Lactococcus hodotermopsidis]
METRHLHYFLTVAKLGNITRAAEQLHITQPTLSRQLIDLEKQLGTSLLIRGKRQITLTAAGVLFQQRASQILAILDKTRNDLLETKEIPAGTVTIGVVETTIAQFLAKKIADFHDHYPQIRIDLYNADGDDNREKLDRGELDMALLIEPVEAAKYHFKRLGPTERWGIIVRKNDRLARRKFVTRHDILGRKTMMSRRAIVSSSLFDWLHIQANDLDIVSTHNLLTNALPLLAQQHLMTIAVEGALTIRPVSNLTFVPFSPNHVSHHVLVWRKNVLLSAAAQLFLDFLLGEG